MNRTTLSLLIAVGVLLVIAVVQRIDFGPGAPQLSSWDGEADRIEIVTPDSEILLQETEAGWVVGEERYPANQQTVRRILNQLSGIGELEIVSEQQNYSQYDLQEGRAIHVAASRGGETVRELYIGKSSSVGRKAYARTPDRGAVFLVSSSLRRTVNTSIADLREKTMLSAQKENIERVVLRNSDGTELVVRQVAGAAESDGGATNGGSAGASAAENGGSADEESGAASEDAVQWQVEGAEIEGSSDAIDALFRTLRGVEATSFDLDLPDGESQATVTVELADGSSHELAVYEQTDQGNYPATVSTAEYPFLLPSTTVSRLFLGAAGFPGGQ